jgi:hypothetical protein
MIETLTEIPATFSIYIGIGLLWTLYLETTVYKQSVGSYFTISDIFLISITWPYSVIIYFGTLIGVMLRGFRNRNLK